MLFELADGGDAIGAELVDRLSDEIGLLATVTLRRLGLVDGPTTVVLGGGVPTGAGRRLVPDIRRRCAKVSPEVDVRIVEAAAGDRRGAARPGPDRAPTRPPSGS
ncbi:ROK family protein [Saccharopolyspora pogona]|uniref:ROK family protein n=1 Tax=Saccharopolyspora pogona TaxID=333966 RepID=UPI0016873944|nr:ROK family protein [Saccharopolyspora pogona]